MVIIYGQAPLYGAYIGVHSLAAHYLLDKTTWVPGHDYREGFDDGFHAHSLHTGDSALHPEHGCHMGVRWVSDGCQMGHTGDSALHPELLHLELDDFDVGLPYMDIIHRQLAIDGRHVALSCLRRKYHDFWTSAHKGVRWAAR